MSKDVATDARLGDAARRNTRARFEQWVQNPMCQANTISAVHNIRMKDVAEADGVRSTFGQSPFALTRGDTFERTLFRNDGDRIITALIEKEVLAQGATGFGDFRIGMNGGPLPTLDDAIDKTKELVRSIANGQETVPAVVASPTVRIPKGVMLPEAVLIIDVMAVRSDLQVPEVIVGEVKTYPDRGGHTDTEDLAVARAQAGLYVHALDLLVVELDLVDRIRVRKDGFLVLTKPGSNMPSVRAGEDLRYQAERARRGFELLEKAALGLPPFDPVGSDPILAVQSADTHYSEQCLAFCDRVEKCHDEALRAGDSAVLGDDVRRFLGDVTLDRAVELLAGDPPLSGLERDLVRRLEEVSM